MGVIIAQKYSAGLLWWDFLKIFLLWSKSEIGLLFFSVALMPQKSWILEELFRESCCFCSQTRHLGGENISMPTTAVSLLYCVECRWFHQQVFEKNPKSFATLALHNFLTYAVRNNFRLGVLFHRIFAAFWFWCELDISSFHLRQLFG